MNRNFICSDILGFGFKISPFHCHSLIRMTILIVFKPFGVLKYTQTVPDRYQRRLSRTTFIFFSPFAILCV